MLEQITPVILTYNEAPNIKRTLSALTWARRIIVLDSLSTDDTRAICEGFGNVEFSQRVFDTHADQWNAAIGLVKSKQWILALDADYVVSDELISELQALQPEPDVDGYWASFVYKIRGQALSGSLYPPVLVLYRSDRAHYKQDGHTQRVHVAGASRHLTKPIFHDDRKSFARWRQSQIRYAAQEADKMANTPFVALSPQDKLRYVGLAPLIILPYTLIAKGLIFNGRAGLEYAWQRFLAECYLQRARLQRA